MPSLSVLLFVFVAQNRRLRRLSSSRCLMLSRPFFAWLNALEVAPPKFWKMPDRPQPLFPLPLCKPAAAPAAALELLLLLLDDEDDDGQP